MKASMPSLSRPIEFSRPAAVSTVRHGLLPGRGCLRDGLGQNGPQARFRSTRCSISRA